VSQREDPELLQLIEYLENNVLPDDRVISKRIVSQSVKGYSILYWMEFCTRRWIGSRLVVPTQLKRQVLFDNNESLYAGHFAPKKLQQRVNQYYYWPRMSVDVHQVRESCVACLSTQGQLRRLRPSLQCILMREPFE